VLAKAVGQLEEYFAGKRTTFDLPLHLPGTEFQKVRWKLARVSAATNALLGRLVGVERVGSAAADSLR
jgi:hypothetical protein